MLCFSGFELYSRWVPLIFLLQKAGIALLWRQQKESMKRTRLIFLNE